MMSLEIILCYTKDKGISMLPEDITALDNESLISWIVKN